MSSMYFIGRLPSSVASSLGLSTRADAVSRGLLPFDLCPDALLLFPQFRSELRAEVGRLEYLAKFNLGASVERCALQPFNGLFFRFHLPHPVAGNQFLGLGKRPVSYRPLSSRKFHPRALRARVEPLAGEHHPGLAQFFVVLAHRGQELGTRHD